MFRLICSIGVTLAVLLSMYVVPVKAAQQGNVTGTFGINAPPTVDSVSIVQTSVTPQVQYTVSVQVTDPDTINDLASVTLKLWYDSDGGTPLESEYDAVTADPNAQNSAVITWTADAPGGTTYTGSASLAPAATTWILGTNTLPVKGNGQNPGDFGLTTFAFQFTVTIGKVATETTGSARWQFGAKAIDSQSQTGFNYDAEGAVMDFYGEISVPAATVNFGDVAPGSAFQNNQQSVGINITYIANGNYDEKISSGASWNGTTYSATLDPTGNVTNAQEFSIRGDDTATYANSVLIDTTGVTVANTGTQTTESGTPVSTFNLWLHVADTFNKDTYSGTITFIIANGL